MPAKAIIPLSEATVNRLINWLIVILFFKILGYFTLTENVAITRVLKVLIRLSMTGFIFLIIRQLQHPRSKINLRSANTLSPFLYGLYLFLGLASLLWSTKPGYSLLQLVMNLESFLFCALFIKAFMLLRTRAQGLSVRLTQLLAPAVFWILLGFVIGLFIAPDLFYRLTHGGTEARLGGYLMNPNELGMLAVVGMGCALAEVYQGGKRVQNWFMLAVMMYALVLTGSRSSMIGFLLIAFYFIKRSGNFKLQVALYAAAILSIPIIVNTIFIKQGDLDEVLSMTGRLPFWKALLTEGLPKAPYFGFGYMRIAYTDAFESVHTYAGKMTHNTFIQVLMNLGFVGFSIVLAQMTVTLRGAFRLKIEEDKVFFLAVFIPILINSFTEFGIFGEANFGILFYQLLIWLVVRSPRNEQKVAFSA